ncbi:uncharacterized protein LOC122248464 [Penaeus japonicus]|uniref:uncharacterized protein LOC122248464 n=1 Tax=Penaeus japonicus TaxID=27405 RepID=UPI001C716E58|nr:uncharacterized protein LOC122248464 [Penaeus japonicus]
MEAKYLMNTLILLVTVITNDVVGGLHITKVGVSTPLAVGESGWLECEWADDGDSIYALKWYLGLDEFYRWTPAEDPPVKTFKIRGEPLRVDASASHKGRVRIQAVTLAAAGVFRCEVSAEAPSFHTESHVAYMTVVDLPDEKPRISVPQDTYQLEEDVTLNCSSPRSQPPAELTFYVNGEQADPSWLVPHNPIAEENNSPNTHPHPHPPGLQTAVLGLKFPLWPRLLRRGSVVVKCTASILNLYWESSEVVIHGDQPYHASIMEGRASSAAAPAVAGQGSLPSLRNLIFGLLSMCWFLH